MPLPGWAGTTPVTIVFVDSGSPLPLLSGMMNWRAPYPGWSRPLVLGCLTFALFMLLGGPALPAASAQTAVPAQPATSAQSADSPLRKEVRILALYYTPRASDGRTLGERRGWQAPAALVNEAAKALTRAAEVGLDIGPLVEALGTWVEAGSIAELGALADHVESASGPLREAVLRLRDSARAVLGRKEDAWRGAAVEVAAWLKLARDAVRGASDLKRLKSAEAWFKKAAAGIREQTFDAVRFVPLLSGLG